MFPQDKNTFLSLLLLTFWFSFTKSISIIYANDGNNHLKYQKDEHIFKLTNHVVLNLEKSFLNSSLITHIYLTDNELCVMRDGAFDGVPNLVYLNLTRNKYTEMQLQDSTLPAIETLVLDETVGVNEYHCDIKREEFGELSYQYCRLEYVFFNFKNLPNLKYLYLRNNQLYSIVDQIGPEIYRSRITHLYLDRNKISSLDFVDSLPQTMTHLYLRNNSLTDLEYSFSRLSISINDPLPLDRLTDLVHLDLSENLISDISDDVFKNLAKLTTLKLDRNYLSRVPRICGLESLEILSISHNRLTEIEQFSFCALSSLKKLNLSNNLITKVSPDEIRNLASLEVLDLSGNRIAILPSNWIAEMNLMALFLNNNRFKHFSHLSLNNFGSLRYVNIRGNDIEVNRSMGLSRDTIIDFMR